MRICATPPSDSEAIIVPQGHAVKRRVVLAADLESVRGSIQPDVGSGVVVWLRAANATSWAGSTIAGHSPSGTPSHDGLRIITISRAHKGRLAFTAAEAGDAMEAGGLQRCCQAHRVLGWNDLLRGYSVWTG